MDASPSGDVATHIGIDLTNGRLEKKCEQLLVASRKRARLTSSVPVTMRSIGNLVLIVIKLNKYALLNQNSLENN